MSADLIEELRAAIAGWEVNGPARGVQELSDVARRAADALAAKDARIAELEREVERVRSERSYIVGFNDGWDEAPLATATEAGWQDISSAPRDGTQILAFNARNGDGPVVVRHYEGVLGSDLRPEDHWGDAATIDGAALYYNGRYFSHWRQLPPAPEAPLRADRAAIERETLERAAEVAETKAQQWDLQRKDGSNDGFNACWDIARYLRALADHPIPSAAGGIHDDR